MRHVNWMFLLLLLSGETFAQQVETMLHARPVELTGNVNVTGIFYSSRGIPNRYLPFNYVISGNPTLHLYGVQIPFSFVIGKQNSSFYQPFNQFGMSPAYKWVTLHAGYRNLTFSPYTLAGHTFLGGGLELNPGKFRFAAIYGLNNDLENYTIAPAFMALKRKLRFSGSLGFQRDDLSRNKRARAHKVIGSANLNADISQRLGIDVNYSNYSVSGCSKAKKGRLPESDRLLRRACSGDQSSRDCPRSSRPLVRGLQIPAGTDPRARSGPAIHTFPRDPHIPP